MRNLISLLLSCEAQAGAMAELSLKKGNTRQLQAIQQTAIELSACITEAMIEADAQRSMSRYNARRLKWALKDLDESFTAI